MAGQGKYTVIELAEAVGVPRTTINDWLGRYAQYIDFAQQGKRKLYTDASIEVLKEISGLRNSGLSSYDIEAELSKRHPVRGEPQAPVEESHENPMPPQMGQQEPKPAIPSAQQQGEEFALMTKRQTDEIARMIGESFQTMARRIEDIERNSSEANAKASRWYAMSLLLLLLILVAGVFSFIKLTKVSGMRDELAKSEIKKDSQLKLLADNTVSLAKQSDELRKNVEALEKGLVEQRQDFDKALQQAKGEGEAARQAETSKLRDAFAAEKLELLKKLEAAGTDSSAREALLKELRRKLVDEESSLKDAAK